MQNCFFCDCFEACKYYFQIRAELSFQHTTLWIGSAHNAIWEYKRKSADALARNKQTEKASLGDGFLLCNLCVLKIWEKLSSSQISHNTRIIQLSLAPFRGNVQGLIEEHFQAPWNWRNSIRLIHRDMVISFNSRENFFAAKMNYLMKTLAAGVSGFCGRRVFTSRFPPKLVEVAAECEHAVSMDKTHSSSTVWREPHGTFQRARSRTEEGVVICRKVH